MIPGALRRMVDNRSSVVRGVIIVILLFDLIMIMIDYDVDLSDL